MERRRYLLRIFPILRCWRFHLRPRLEHGRAPWFAFLAMRPLRFIASNSATSTPSAPPSSRASGPWLAARSGEPPKLRTAARGAGAALAS